ncbi:hypothetical protein [Gloeocapsa sp. PCC 7428]|uniref:hypothetical protein n=1 Tax=Gloeocapsa sp. PCC 7428 TaxID=1173026 RepID=UPI0002F5928C|nr:hypothetical protein [Gloeocapsa sp. PCC 7428]
MIAQTTTNEFSNKVRSPVISILLMSVIGRYLRYTLPLHCALRDRLWGRFSDWVRSLIKLCVIKPPITALQTQE